MEDLSKLSKAELIERLNSQQDAPQKSFTDFEDEIGQLDRLVASNNPNQMTYSVKNDHQNIYLYNEFGRRLGPMHPANARITMANFAKKGIRLYTKPRTPEQIEAYKNSPKGKASFAKWQNQREKVRMNSKGDKLKRMISDISKEVATSVIKAKSEV